MRIVYLGMGGILSLAPLERLLEAGCRIEAVAVPSPSFEPVFRRLHGTPSPSALPLVGSYIERTIVHLAWERQIPVFEMGDLSADVVERGFQQLAPDLVLVSCFSRRIPRKLLAQPAHGFLNLHPSLLPAYRGPYPLFWQFHDGLTNIGVTVHFMDETLDTGDIALQRSLTLADGISGLEAERVAGDAGGVLFVEAIQRLAAGTLPRYPQPANGSYQPMPGAADFRLETSWSARRAFNFMRGTAAWGMPYPVLVVGEERRLKTAITYDPEGVLGAPFELSDEEIRIQFNPGVLHAMLA